MVGADPWAPTQAERRFVDRLDQIGCGRVRRLLAEREAAFQRLSHAEELAAIDRKVGKTVPKRPRGRPSRKDIERAAVVMALAKHEGAIRPAARELGVPRNTLSRHAAAIPEWTWRYGPAVLEVHARVLDASGVTREVAQKRGYETVQRGGEPQSGMLVPLWTVHGRRAWSQIRYDAPRQHRERYRNASDAHPIVDCSPAARPRVLDRDEPLYVTESPRKADAAVSRGLACVDFPGIRMLCLDDATWDYIGVRHRDVRVCFDGDVGVKGDVAAAEWWLAEYLGGKGARVTVYRLPPDQGLDDYLASGKTIDALSVIDLPTEAPSVRWSPWRS